jgi:hypothetical protein
MPAVAGHSDDKRSVPVTDRRRLRVITTCDCFFLDYNSRPEMHKTRRDTMKSAIKAMMIGVAACTFAAPAFAYTLSGTIPPASKPVVIDLQKPFPPQYHHVRLTLTTPSKSLGIGYEVEFCVGPAANPCQVPLHFLGGQEIIVSYRSSDLSTYAVTLSQATSGTPSYTLKVDYSD